MLRKWLNCLWRLNGPGSASQRPRKADGLGPIWVRVKRQKTSVPARMQSDREWLLSYADCYFIQAYNRENEASPPWGGQSSLFSLMIRRLLISSRNTVMDTPRIMSSPISGHLWPRQVDTVNCHRITVLICCRDEDTDGEGGWVPCPAVQLVITDAEPKWRQAGWPPECSLLIGTFQGRRLRWGGRAREEGSGVQCWALVSSQPGRGRTGM